MKVDIYNTDKKYHIIYADPPWQYKVWSRDTGLGRSAESHYKTMNKKEIQDMGETIERISEKDCALFLWVTMPNLIEGLELIKKWGFTYKTCAFSWMKVYSNGNPFVGMGYWTRSNLEICLLATKGKPKRISKSVKQAIIEKPREHSRKPDCVRERIVELMGDLPRIELFARQYADGWDCWGNEV